MSSAIPGSTLMTKLDAIPVSRSITCKNKIPRRLDNILDLEKTCKVKVQLNGTKLIYICVLKLLTIPIRCVSILIMQGISYSSVVRLDIETF